MLSLRKDAVNIAEFRSHGVAVSYGGGIGSAPYVYVSGPAFYSYKDRTKFVSDDVSPRVDGALKLRSNAFSRKRSISEDLLITQLGSAVNPGYNKPRYGQTTERLPIDVEGLDYSVINELVSKARIAAHSDFLDEIRNANAMLPIIYMERVATHNMIASRVLAIKEALWNAKRDAKRLITNLSGTTVFRGRPISNLSAYWLEFWFGWFPSVMDIWTLATHSGSITERVVHGRSSRYKAVRRDIGVPITGAKCAEKYRVQAHARATVIITDPAVKTAQEFGLLNPALVLWEATRLSWLIDYFTSFSSWLATFDAFAGVTVTDYNITYSIEVKGEYSVLPPKSTKDMVINIGGYTMDLVAVSTARPGTINYRHKVRELYMPVIPVVQLSSDLSFKKWANALSLLTVRLRT